MSESNDKTGSVILDLAVNDGSFNFDADISDALSDANEELRAIEEQITETEETVKKLTPECDKTDYILAASSGALCGIIDIFLVGEPGKSPIGDITDKWFGDRTIDFAKICGYDEPKDCDNPLHKAIEFLEGKFKIPYDQSVGGESFKKILYLTPSNHHFKSLGHNPTLLGLFFSIMDQFNNTSDFISKGELITLTNSNGEFNLEGNSISGKIFSGFINWFGHIMSDISGSSESIGRGMGIPSPLWAWTNDVIAIKSKLKMPISKFDKSLKELALKIFNKDYEVRLNTPRIVEVSEFDKRINKLALDTYTKKYDARFQTAQTIPVIINELLVRFLYSARRLVKYFIEQPKEEHSLQLLWETCEPFSNATVKRMLTVAHGTFCLIDVGDASIRSLRKGKVHFNPKKFIMRLNVPGIGRFAISLYGEVNRGINLRDAKEEVFFLRREKIIVEDYISGLNTLAELYDDKELLTFVKDLKESNAYKEGFEKTVLLAEKRRVPEEKILKTKSDIDNYFNGGSLE